MHRPESHRQDLPRREQVPFETPDSENPAQVMDPHVNHLLENLRYRLPRKKENNVHSVFQVKDQQYCANNQRDDRRAFKSQ